MAGGFRRLPLLIYSLLEENTEENTETNENIMRMDDLLIFMMLDEHKKMYRNVAVRTDSYAERTVPRLSDSSFRQHFRLSRSTAQTPVELLGNCPEIPVPRERGRPTVDLDHKRLKTQLRSIDCNKSCKNKNINAIYGVNFRFYRLFFNLKSK